MKWVWDRARKEYTDNEIKRRKKKKRRNKRSKCELLVTRTAE